MIKILTRQAIRLTALMALPVSLQCCAPSAPATAYGENVSFYFNSGFACPEHVPSWRQLGEKEGAPPRSTPRPGDASDSFEKALVDLGHRHSHHTKRQTP